MKTKEKLFRLLKSLEGWGWQREARGWGVSPGWLDPAQLPTPSPPPAGSATPFALSLSSLPSTCTQLNSDGERPCLWGISVILAPRLKDMPAADEENELRKADAAHVPTAGRGEWGVAWDLSSQRLLLLAVLPAGCQSPSPECVA